MKIRQNINLELKTIPYLFFTTVAKQKHVIDAYSKSVQGLFVKPNEINKCDVLPLILEQKQ